MKLQSFLRILRIKICFDRRTLEYNSAVTIFISLHRVIFILTDKRNNDNHYKKHTTALPRGHWNRRPKPIHPKRMDRTTTTLYQKDLRQ